MARKDWDILKYTFARKILTSNAQFKMIFGGSSVTAGHDNAYNDSYPLVVERRLGPVLDKVGVHLEVVNIAQGANDCMPSDLCYDTMGGFHADFYSWEQSFNCGREPQYIEVVARLAATNRAAFYVASSGGMVPKECPPSTDSVPYSSEAWTPSSTGLGEWRPTSQELGTVRDQMVKMHKGGSSMGRFASYVSKYTGISLSGMNLGATYPAETCRKHSTVWGKDKECNAGAIFEKCALKFLTKEAAVYGLGSGARWHPTRGIHLLRGELIAWLYGLTLLDALYMTRKELSEGTAALFAKYSERLDSLQYHGKLPSPSTCQREPIACTYKTVCYTDFSPLHTNLTLSSRVVGPTSWKYLVVRTPNKQRRPPSDEELRPVYISSAGPEGGEIYLRVDVSAARNKVLLCAYKMKDNFSNLEFKVELDVSMDRLHSGYSPVNRERKIWAAHEAAGVHCIMLKSFPPGTHVIGLQPKSMTKVGISHVITYDS
eukprot:CAMPEP_0185032004 /NCGR_PEP_ID=MMETSP1103-20130426/19815_1 /TAXON_ID=36769 /ORGANISM="Paraphysomonas bandaiensis, Strain Caron Lab Isolate" /LENGTH=486 /DNA_ID=CAMNT_0027567733 /DNA_START=228 /DNA_END=1688 /DNA_ORIENTATION=-